MVHQLTIKLIPARLLYFKSKMFLREVAKGYHDNSGQYLSHSRINMKLLDEQFYEEIIEYDTDRY